MSHLVVIGDGFQECCLVDAHEGRKFFKCVGAVEDAPLDGVLDGIALVGAHIDVELAQHLDVVVDALPLGADAVFCQALDDLRDAQAVLRIGLLLLYLQQVMPLQLRLACVRHRHHSAF